ncbi:MAG: hypothetical protein JRF02_05585 [Deltaproteobacteria bacterium]|jgi:hypothetical protein|nr:hypothetical protein [Deltaproteobacteria bacterium]
MAGFLRKIKEKLRILSGKIEEHQQAITFAEAGHHEHVDEILRDKEVEKVKKPSKLVVVGKESTFSRELIDYSLEMAQRMSSEMIALNTAPLSSGAHKLLSSTRDTMCQEFQELSEKNARLFQEEANRKGVHFKHLVKFTDTDEALEEIGEEVLIDFVISENEGEEVAARVESGESLRQEIFVYSIL